MHTSHIWKKIYIMDRGQFNISTVHVSQLANENLYLLQISILVMNIYLVYNWIFMWCTNKCFDIFYVSSYLMFGVHLLWSQFMIHEAWYYYFSILQLMIISFIHYEDLQGTQISIWYFLKKKPHYLIYGLHLYCFIITCEK